MKQATEKGARERENSYGRHQRRIHFRLLQKVSRYAESSDDEIQQHLNELQDERSIERVLNFYASWTIMAGALLGFWHPVWLIIPLIGSALLLQFAIRGWCFPMSYLRESGFRTVEEINEERYALKALRGDFEHLQLSGSQHLQNASDYLKAVER